MFLNSCVIIIHIYNAYIYIYIYKSNKDIQKPTQNMYLKNEKVSLYVNK